MTDAETVLDLDDAQRRRAQQLHSESAVVDGLLPMTYVDEPEYRDDLQQGGVTAGNFTVASRVAFSRATKQIQDSKQRIRSLSDRYRLAETVTAVRDAQESDRTAVIMGFQDTMPLAPEDRMQIGDNTEYLHAFANMGVRIIQLTYNNLNYVGAGCCERNDPGLSDYGRTLVDAMNTVGVVVDLSHCGDTTTMDAIQYSDDPVVLSHVGARSLSNIGRNKTDDHIKAVGKNGGVVGVTFFPPCVKSHPDTHEVQPATVHDVLDHIEHVVDLIGIDHVGFGTDMNDMYLDEGRTPPYAAYRNFRKDYPDVYGRGPIDHYEPFPDGIERHTKLETLTQGLIARGYSDDEIKKILGENFLRVFEDVWEP